VLAGDFNFVDARIDRLSPGAATNGDGSSSGAAYAPQAADAAASAAARRTRRRERQPRPPLRQLAARDVAPSRAQTRVPGAGRPLAPGSPTRREFTYLQHAQRIARGPRVRRAGSRAARCAHSSRSRARRLDHSPTFVDLAAGPPRRRAAPGPIRRAPGLPTGRRRRRPTSRAGWGSRRTGLSGRWSGRDSRRRGSRGTCSRQRTWRRLHAGQGSRPGRGKARRLNAAADAPREPRAATRRRGADRRRRGCGWRTSAPRTALDAPENIARAGRTTPCWRRIVRSRWRPGRRPRRTGWRSAARGCTRGAALAGHDGNAAASGWSGRRRRSCATLTGRS